MRREEADNTMDLLTRFTRIEERLRALRLGARGAAAIATSCLLIGLLLATGLSWPRPSEADRLYQPVSTTEPLTTIPGSFADLAAKLSPAVVNVQVTKVEKLGMEMPMLPKEPFDNDSPFGPFFKRFFKQMPHGEFRSQGSGSGFIISPEGYILTNNHVVDEAKEVTVTLANKEEYTATVVGRDPKTDIAILKIRPKGSLPTVVFGDSKGLRVGDWVLAVGDPFGLSNTVTAGIVSAKGRVIGAGPYDDFIQTDASINPGNSGGPLFNMKGEVVGINTAIVAQGQGIGFAIPIDIVKPLILPLETKGEVTRGWLGVSIQSITPALQKSLHLPDRTGALVADVVKGSPAEKAGMQRGDVIVAFDGKPVPKGDLLPAMVAGTPINKQVTLTMLRDQKRETLSLTVGKMPTTEMVQAGPDESSRAKWGLTLESLTPRTAEQLGVPIDAGVLVAGVQEGSPADLAGIQKGDLIQEVNRHKVASVREVQAAIEKSKNTDALLLLVKRGGTSLFAALEAK